MNDIFHLFACSATYESRLGDARFSSHALCQFNFCSSFHPPHPPLQRVSDNISTKGSQSVGGGKKSTRRHVMNQSGSQHFDDLLLFIGVYLSDEINLNRDFLFNPTIYLS